MDSLHAEGLRLFGQRVRTERRALGLNSSDLAAMLPEALRITGAQLRNYELGKSSITEAMARAIEGALINAQVAANIEAMSPGELIALLRSVPGHDQLAPDVGRRIERMEAQLDRIEDALRRAIGID